MAWFDIVKLGKTGKHFVLWRCYSSDLTTIDAIVYNFIDHLTYGFNISLLAYPWV